MAQVGIAEVVEEMELLSKVIFVVVIFWKQDGKKGSQKHRKITGKNTKTGLTLDLHETKIGLKLDYHWTNAALKPDYNWIKIALNL